MQKKEPPTMLQHVFDKFDMRSHSGAQLPPRTNTDNPTPKAYQQTNNNTNRPIPSSAGFQILDTLDLMSRATGSGNSNSRDNNNNLLLDPLSEDDPGSLSADEAETGEDGIIRSSRKRVAKARFAYREDPEYWTGRRGSTILQRGRRRSSMMYPQVKETADSAALACSLMI